MTSEIFSANDWTMYPFSTQNAQDYKNLMSVYLDAAFYPQLTESDFRFAPRLWSDKNTEYGY